MVLSDELIPLHLHPLLFHDFAKQSRWGTVLLPLGRVSTLFLSTQVLRCSPGLIRYHLTANAVHALDRFDPVRLLTDHFEIKTREVVAQVDAFIFHPKSCLFWWVLCFKLNSVV